MPHVLAMLMFLPCRPSRHFVEKQKSLPLYSRSLLPLLSWTFTMLLLLSMLSQSGPLFAEPIPVRYKEGAIHGFLALRTEKGKTVAAGDLIQVTHGDRVVSHLVFRFTDGSVDDETAVFTQRDCFRLIRDHHIQKGPAFPHPTDVLINTSTGQVTVRLTENGQQKVETSHLDLPLDLSNGMILDLLKNIRPGTTETKLSYLAVTPKPRLVKLSLMPRGEEAFSVAGIHHKAIRFRAKVELGGITGILAPMMGKQPADTDVWVVEGEAPAFVKSEGPLYLGGPIWRIEMTSPVWQRASYESH